MGSPRRSPQSRVCSRSNEAPNFVASSMEAVGKMVFAPFATASVMHVVARITSMTTATRPTTSPSSTVPGAK